MRELHPETRWLVDRLRLAPHPEGGFYREVWRSPGRVHTPRGERAAMTVIHFLLPAGAFSAFHRVHADEAWQHAGGDPIDLHVLAPSGEHRVHRLAAPDPGTAVHHVVVPAGHWQAARAAGAHHALASCTVAPGFEFSDFEMAEAGTLLALRPDLATVIRALCRDRAGP